MTKTIVLLLAMFGLMTPFTAAGRALNLLAFFLVVAGLFWKKAGEKLAIAVLLILAIQVLLTGGLEGGKITDQLATPLGANYTTDMRAFLKTSQLMKQGESFYPAFATGMAGLRDGSFHPDVAAWRQPFLFYVWAILPGNSLTIYYLWQAIILLDLAAAFLVAKKILPVHLAILSPFILWPYFHFSLVDLTLLQPEWWAMSFFLFGFGFYLYNRRLPAGIFWALALATRELFFIPITFFLLLSLRQNRQEFFKIFITIAIFGLYFVFYHLPNISQFQTEWIRSSRHGGLYALHSLFAYSSWSYFLGLFRPFILLLALSMVGFWRHRNVTILVTFFPFLIFAVLLAIFGGIDETRDYWGIYFVPLLLASTPILILPPGK